MRASNEGSAIDPEAYASLLLEDEDREGRGLAESILGTTDAAVVFDGVRDLCARKGLPAVERVFFFEISVGATFGLLLGDGSRVVLKAHPPERDVRFLEAVHRVQGHLFRSGLPCPRPIAGPSAFGGGYAVVEEFVDRGERADAHQPAVRRSMARMLARQIRLSRGVADVGDLRLDWKWPSDRLWPAPHNALFDFGATAEGARWIDAIAAPAKATVDASESPYVVGHADWSVKHFRFEGGEISAVYDWDSLRLDKEAVIVGGAAATFPATWYLPVESRAPSPDEMRLFIHEYEAARGTPLSGSEWDAVVSMTVYAMAYAARCEHAIDQEEKDPAGGFRAVLRGREEEYLRIASEDGATA